MAATALREHYFEFLPGAICCFALFLIGGTALFFLPVGFSLLAWRAVRVLKLSHNTSAWWWFNRVPFYWLNLLLVALLFFVIVTLITLPAALVFEVKELESSVELDALLLVVLVLSLCGAYRLWPSLVLPYLMGGRDYYRYPWDKIIPPHEGPSWIGPGILKAWQVTGLREVRHRASVPATITLSIVALLSYAVFFTYSAQPLFGALGLILVCFLLLPFLFAFLSLAGWIAIVVSGESPLSVAPAVSDEIVDDEQIARMQEQLLDERLFIHRFPGKVGDSRKLVLPHDIVRRKNKALLQELENLGPNRKWHEGNYIEIWDNPTDRRNDMPPSIIVDLQGVILGVYVDNRSSAAYRALMRLIDKWRQEFSVIGELH